ncbi:nucleotidyltransferase domain-containing protein [Sulfuritalea sp.]|uniref:nucleotidyltransferase domain-containing protein n=1 Tax=Sulfuritalea sp. TaxID=2480090 RepID=UPI00286E44E5|nr:nucleotidyltransferase domain-containing protein [Sulfuritalea sp.]
MAGTTTLIDLTLLHLMPAVPAGTRVIVFGSQARGDADSGSDIDLLVVEPEVSSRADEMVRLSNLLGRHLIPADVVVISREQYERQCEIPNTLAWRAKRDGREYELAH